MKTTPKKSFNTRILAGTALAALLSANSALAQVKDEIIVTATKRAEKLTEVPIAISVFGADDIDQTGVRELREISEYIPNVQISQHNDFRAVVTIRGVGSNSRNIGFDSRVGVYVDGVYMGQSPSLNQELLDLERVEVLRGPQGMLFGKNTVAGAISLVTKKPDSTETFGKLTADFGNLNYRSFKGMVNTPISDKMALKVSALKTDRDGYINNVTTGNKLDEKNVIAGRAQLSFQPTDNIDLNLSVDSLHSEGNILVGKPVTDLLGLGPALLQNEPYKVALHFDPRENRSVSGAAFDASIHLANDYTLKSISSYRSTDAFYRNTTDYSPVSIVFIDYRDIFSQTSQEFQLISPSDQKLTWMGGAYYYKQIGKTQRDVTLGDQFEETFIAGAVAPSVAPLLGLNPANLTNAQLSLISSIVGFGPEGSKIFNRGKVNTESIAGYINGSYDLTDQWVLGGGLRYTHETKDANWLLDGRNSGVFAIGSTGSDPNNPSPLLNSRSDDYASVAASLSYNMSDAVNLYAKFSTGFKSGGFNLDYINANELAANSGLEFGKETVRSYELGYKGALMDGRLKLNLAAFLADYNNYQVNQFVDLGGGRTSIRITNAAKVRTKGLEADVSFQATENLFLQGTAGYLDAKFDSFPGGGTAGADATGKKLVNAPDFTASASAQYTIPVEQWGGNVFVRADITHRDGYYTTADNIKTTPYRVAPGSVPFGYIPKLTQLNGRIGFESDKGGYGLYVWGHNLTNEKTFVDDFRDFFGTIVHHPNTPRTYGVELVKDF